jgi:hypothetical protein
MQEHILIANHKLTLSDMGNGYIALMITDRFNGRRVLEHEPAPFKPEQLDKVVNKAVATLHNKTYTTSKEVNEAWLRYGHPMS